MSNRKLINQNQFWALNDRGKDALFTLVSKGINIDLAFELLNLLYSDIEIYSLEEQEDGPENREAGRKNR